MLLFPAFKMEDPFGDYASVDTEHALADERVFGVLKLTKLGSWNKTALGRSGKRTVWAPWQHILEKLEELEMKVSDY